MTHATVAPPHATLSVRAHVYHHTPIADARDELRGSAYSSAVSNVRAVPPFALEQYVDRHRRTRGRGLEKKSICATTYAGEQKVESVCCGSSSLGQWSVRALRAARGRRRTHLGGRRERQVAAAADLCWRATASRGSTGLRGARAPRGSRCRRCGMFWRNHDGKEEWHEGVKPRGVHPKRPS